MPNDGKLSSIFLSNSFPNIAIFPDVAESRPISIFIKVVFPAPEGPSKPKISPSSTLKEILFKTCRWSNALQTSFI